MSKYFVTFETTIWYLWELRLSRECPVREVTPSVASGVVSRLATTINKCLALESNCESQAAFVVHYHNSDTRAEKATKGEIRVTKRRRIASRHGSKQTWVALPNNANCRQGRKTVGPHSLSLRLSVSRNLCHDTAIRHYCGAITDIADN